MAATTRRSRWDDIGHPTAAGLAFAPFALLFTVWMPSLALVFGAVAVAAGSLDLRWGSARQRRFALLAIGLGFLAIVVTLIVVAITTPDPVSGTAGTVDRPA
jgi:hypothetical protein